MPDSDGRPAGRPAGRAGLIANPGTRAARPPVAAAGLRLLGWDDGPLRLLLPADCVLEVTAAGEVRPVPAGPAWLRGWAEWRHLTLPLVTPRPLPDAAAGPAVRAAAAPAGRGEPPRRGDRWLVCIGPLDGQGVDLFALHAATHPRLESLPTASLMEALAAGPAPVPHAAPPGPGYDGGSDGSPDGGSDGSPAAGPAGGADGGEPDQPGAAPWLRPITWRGSAALVPDLAALQSALVALLL